MASAWKYLVFFALVYLHSSESRFTLHLEDTLYLPYEYTPIPRFDYNKDAGGRVKYDPTYNFAYVAGKDLIHVIDMRDILHLDNVFHVHEPGFRFTDIALCGEYVIAPADNLVDRDDGKLFIFKKYNAVSVEMPIVQVIDLNHNPAHVAVSKNCQMILVSLEGEAWEENGVITDPEGGVAYFAFSSGDLGTTPNHKDLDFTHFNADSADYIQRGVRHVYPNSTFSQDLEPEGITMKYDEQVAYVSLQENNAIAEVDISDFASARIVELFPLGNKAWHDLVMDPSDWDQDIRLNNWKVFGMYQPDDVRYFEVDSVGYILCANEGSTKEYPSWTEVKRGQDFMLEDLVHSGVSQAVKDALLTTSNLGRLEFTTVNGREADGKYSDFYSFGGRSFSIRLASNPSTILYDSGDLTAKHHATLLPIMFNADPEESTLTMLQTRDTRSDNRGAEPEAVAVGTVDGEKLFFIGNERSSSVEVYSVRHGVTNPLFHNITFGTQYIDVGKTWETLYTEHNVGDISPEGLEFIEARDSPILKPLLLVSGSVSGTISVFLVSKEDEIEDDILAAKVNELFTRVDNNTDQLLTIDEHHWLILEGDMDHDHRIDEDEFYDDFRVKAGLLEEKKGFVFNELDVNNDRYLTSFDTDALFYLADRDATSVITRDQFGREWKRILHNNIDLGQ